MKKITLKNWKSRSAEQQAILEEIAAKFRNSGKNLKTLVFTGDEYTAEDWTLPLELAQILASGGDRVAVVNADMSIFEEESQITGQSVGLVQYLSGHCQADDIICETDLKNVDLVPVGGNSSNPGLLLEAEEMDQLLKQLADSHDWVFVYAEPITSYNLSSLLLVKRCAGAVLLAKDRATRRATLKNSRIAIERTGKPVVGAIVTDAKKPQDY